MTDFWKILIILIGVWRPIALAYLLVKLCIKKRITLRELITDNFYHKVYYQEGVFGPLTPLFGRMIYGKGYFKWRKPKAVPTPIKDKLKDKANAILTVKL